MKKVINNLYRISIKILCAFIPNKNLRKKIRDNTYKKQKDIPIKKLKKIYPNSIFFWLPIGGVGEFTEIICSMKPFKEKINKNIVLLTNKKLERDVVSLIDKNIVKCYYEDNLFFKDIKNLNKLENLNTETIYGFNGMLATNKKNKKYFFHEVVKEFFNLSKETKRDIIIAVRPKNKDKNFLELEKIFKNKKTIFIFPEANTYDYTIITKEVWIDIANKLTNDGYTCIFNSKEKYGDFINVFLDIKETLYLASLANSIITFRSGIAELLAISTICNIIVVYPNGKTHLFTKRTNFPKTIKEYIEEIENGETIYITDKNKSGIEIIATFDCIAENYNRKNCFEYIYDFDNEEFYNYIINNTSNINKYLIR